MIFITLGSDPPLKSDNHFLATRPFFEHFWKKVYFSLWKSQNTLVLEMQNVMHIATNAGHTVQNDGRTMQNDGSTTQNVGCNTLNVSPISLRNIVLGHPVHIFWVSLYFTKMLNLNSTNLYSNMKIYLWNG